MGIERLVEGTTDPAFAIDAAGRVVAVNPAAAMLVGAPAEDLLDRHCSEVVRALDGAGERTCRLEGCPTLGLLSEGCATDLPWCSWITADGARLPISASALAIPRDARPDATAAVILLHRSDRPAPRHDGSREATSAASPPTEVSVRLFGRPECLLDGEARPLRRRRAFELLALLALAGNEGQRRNQLCRALWPEPSEGDERTHLRVLFHSLRQALGDDVTRHDPQDRDRIQLAPHVSVDVVAFERGAAALLRCRVDVTSDEEARLAEIDGLLAMYAGDLDECGEFGAWALPHRERLRSLQLALLARASRLAVRLGDTARAMRYCHRATATDPLQEEFQIALIAAYGELGQRREAVAQYRLYRDALASDLALQPSVAVEQALRWAIRTR